MIFANVNSYKQIALYVLPAAAASTAETLSFLGVDRNGEANGAAKSYGAPKLWFFDPDKINQMLTVLSFEEFFHFGFAKSLEHEKIELYKAVDTFNYTKFNALPCNNALKTQGLIHVPVLLPFTQYENHSEFMECIYRISISVFAPFFIYTDLEPNNLGGPLFLESFSISVNDAQDLECSLKFQGGTIVPDILGGRPYFNDVNDQGTPTLRQNNQTYRTAKNYDCVLIIGDIATVDATQGFYNSLGEQIAWMSGQDFEIVEMSLNINQELDLKYTANDGFTKTLFDGPSFISLKERKVSGSITIISATDLSLFYYNYDKNIQSLTMYFGGPFFYPMKNVVFQPFKMELQADQSTYRHKIDFIALVQPTSNKNYFKQNVFDLFIDGLPIDGTLKTNPQT